MTTFFFFRFPGTFLDLTVALDRLEHSEPFEQYNIEFLDPCPMCRKTASSSAQNGHESSLSLSVIVSEFTNDPCPESQLVFEVSLDFLGLDFLEVLRLFRVRTDDALWLEIHGILLLYFA